MQLFGKELFKFKKDPVFLYDFAQHGLFRGSGFWEEESLDEAYMALGEVSDAPLNLKRGRGRPKKVKIPEKIEMSPHDVYKLNSLNDNNFQIRRDEAYIQQMVEEIDEKLSILGDAPKKRNRSGISSLISDETGGTKYAREELISIKERVLNRKRIDEFTTILETYPHTTSKLINDVLQKVSNLKMGTANEFVPDFPKDAIQAMKEYTDFCVKLCNKKPVFYVIADKKDFQKKNDRRDPILLAESPFGFFWSILGAWSDEMVYLGDL